LVDDDEGGQVRMVRKRGSQREKHRTFRKKITMQ
jgi:hypothetical protein